MLKALTLWQLVILGAKPFEWRRWRAPGSIVGQRIVIHAGVRRIVASEIEDLIANLEQGDLFHTGLDAAQALPLLRAVLAEGIVLPTGAGLGTALLGNPRLAADIVTGHLDSDRLDHQVWGWPLSEIVPFAEPFPIRGRQGFWTWPDAAEMAEAA